MTSPIRALGGILVLVALVAVATGPRAGAAADLEVIPGCTLLPTDWADGDSFRVRTPSGE